MDAQTQAETGRTWILAPLAGYTDLPFRQACRRQGCRYAFTPLIDAGALAYDRPGNATILLRGDDESWLGTQLLGSDPGLLDRAARKLAPLGFDRVDINMGCPVRKVTRRGAGAALPLDSELALRCIAAVVKGCAGIPVSVKMRVLHPTDPAPTCAVARRFVEAGITGVTVHGRTWEQVYSGPVAAAVIRALRETLPVPVTANGGIFTRADGLALAAATGCRELMVARGAIGNPWVFRELAAPDAAPPSHEDVCAELRRHVLGLVALYGERAAMRRGRRIILSYLCGRGYRHALRRAVGSVADLAAFEELFAVILGEGPSEGYRPEERRRAALELQD
ncbi:MAG: tRNA-dihydrouridine synthase family protein [Lentisphaeria bacterium]|nr:tRNA-dihydrouridine synthase family protein [Lentisphaeria bacterium]